MTDDQMAERPGHVIEVQIFRNLLKYILLQPSEYNQVIKSPITSDLLAFGLTLAKCTQLLLATFSNKFS